MKKNELYRKIMFESENYYGLQVLQNAVQLCDIIYIDHHYNIGKEFTYLDKFEAKKTVGLDKHYENSKWLSFRKKRFVASIDLLSDGGIIFVSIDDIEQADLKISMDEILFLDKKGCYYIGSELIIGDAGGTLNKQPILWTTIYFKPKSKKIAYLENFSAEKAKISNNESKIYNNSLGNCWFEAGYNVIRPPRKVNKLVFWT